MTHVLSLPFSHRLTPALKSGKKHKARIGERERVRESGSDKRRNWLSGIVVVVAVVGGGGGGGGTSRQGHTRPSATSVEHQRIKATTTTWRQKWNWRSSRTPIIAFVVFCYCSSGLWNMLIWAGRRGVAGAYPRQLIRVYFLVSAEWKLQRMWVEGLFVCVSVVCWLGLCELNPLWLLTCYTSKAATLVASCLCHNLMWQYLVQHIASCEFMYNYKKGNKLRLFCFNT